MKKIANFEGLYGELNTRPDTHYIFSELLETRSRTFNWVVNPHIHTNLYQVFFIKSGHVTFKEAAQEVAMSAPCIFWIPPSSLHGLSYSPDTTGHILTLADTLVEELLVVSPPVAVMLGQIQRLHFFDTHRSFAAVLSLIEQINTELFSDKPEKKALLHLYLQQLFIVLFRIGKLQEERSIQAENLTLKHFQQFQKSLKASDYDKPMPEFARELGITTVHLNRICQAVAGKSASELVQAHVIQEAQKYLTYTSYSVSEIAYLLKFEYPNYFAKLFKKHTGMSPKAFRARGYT